MSAPTPRVYHKKPGVVSAGREVSVSETHGSHPEYSA